LSIKKQTVIGVFAMTERTDLVVTN
jgi:hypothetical protein